MLSAFVPRIAIIGGGPAGLVLRNVLARHNVAATVYERDSEFSSRAHLGGTLDMHEETGQAALKGAGVWDAFLKHSRPEGEELIMVEKDGSVKYHHTPPPDAPPARPEIDRTTLRKILLDAAPADSVKWGHAFVSATPVSDSAEWEVAFANGHKTIVDLVVGADGTWSRVRPLVSDTPLRYTGITAAEISFGPEVGAAHPELMARIGNGSVWAFDEGTSHGLGIQRNGDGRVRTYVFVGTEENVLPSDPSEAIAFMVKRYEDWAPWLRQIIELADPQAIYNRPLYVLPVGHSWPHRKGITLIGDAANLMGPFAGKGGNIAMYAAWQLGLALAEARNGTAEDLDAAVAKFEQDVRPVVTAAAKESENNMLNAVNPEVDTAQNMVDWYKDMNGEEAKPPAA